MKKLSKFLPEVRERAVWAAAGDESEPSSEVSAVGELTGITGSGDCRRVR